MEIELRHLRLVRAVAEEGSISRAAPVLGSTQPAVTRQLRRLEETLGGELFQRSRGGVDPTPLGRLVVTRARSVLPVMDSLQRDVELTSTREPAQVRVGARAGAAMVGLLRGMRSVLPVTEVIADSEARIDGLLEMVTAGRLDVASLHEYAGHELSLSSDVERRVVTTDPVFVMMSGRHPLAGRQELDLSELSKEEWVLSPLDADREHDCFAAACDRAGFTPKVSQYLSGSPTIEMVRSGEALGLCYALAQFSDIVTLPLRGAPLTYRHLLLFNRRGPLLPYADRLTTMVHSEINTAACNHPTYGPWLARHGWLPHAARRAS
ncbi:MAG: LysR family transcriptional regulator [Nocardioidaceae bacterium]